MKGQRSYRKAYEEAAKERDANTSTVVTTKKLIHKRTHKIRNQLMNNRFKNRIMIVQFIAIVFGIAYFFYQRSQIDLLRVSAYANEQRANNCYLDVLRLRNKLDSIILRTDSIGVTVAASF